MTLGDSNRIPGLDPEERAGLLRAVEAATRLGRTQWIARVAPADTIEGLACYARSRAADRFYWERVETGELVVAWGRVDETESAGTERFRDVEAWADRVASRLHWIGARRDASAPTFFGGFGFEDDAKSSEEWKAFPAARFVLPEVIGESRGGVSRWIAIARIEPGARVDTVEAALAERLAVALAMAEREADAQRDVAAVAPSEPFGWEPGPEYRVRSDRAHSVFTGQVESALAGIESGRFEKVVLARSLRVDHDGMLDVASFLGRLRDLYPSCTLVAIGRGHHTFLAATPETLIRVRGDRIETAALAGSKPRGRTPEEDVALADALLASDKERAEHAHVADAIRDVLEPYCEELESPDQPRLRALFGIQHLETPFVGRLHEGTSNGTLLALAAALHPTPAVGGLPKAAAREWLRRNEGLDRGWYASPIGWLDTQGGGDLSVALRSALIHDEVAEDGGGEGVDGRVSSHARLFAGAGIVAGSLPDQELAETRVKLRALLAPLTEI